MKYSHLVCGLLLSTTFASNAYATSFCQKAEHDINTAYQNFRNFDDVGVFDKFDDNAENLLTLVLNTFNNKQSLTCNWSNLKEFYINKSPDGRLMSISWQTDGGGTMKTFDTVLQYHDGKHLHAIDANIVLVTDINQMQLNKQSVYFVTSWGAGDTSSHGQVISLFGIKNHQITPAKLIKTKQGLTHQIDFAYNPFSIPDDIDELIHIHPKRQEFSIPVVIENDAYPNGEVTKRTLRYRFDGKHFVYVK